MKSASLNTDTSKHFPTGQHGIGLSADPQNKNVSGPVIGHIVNPRKDLSGLQPRKSCGTSSGNGTTALQPSTRLAAVTPFVFTALVSSSQVFSLTYLSYLQLLYFSLYIITCNTY